MFLQVGDEPAVVQEYLHRPWNRGSLHGSTGVSISHGARAKVDYERFAILDPIGVALDQRKTDS